MWRRLVARGASADALTRHTGVARATTRADRRGDGVIGEFEAPFSPSVDLAGFVVTADVTHTTRDHATHLRQRSALHVLRQNQKPLPHPIRHDRLKHLAQASTPRPPTPPRDPATTDFAETQRETNPPPCPGRAPAKRVSAAHNVSRTQIRVPTAVTRLGHASGSLCAHSAIVLIGRSPSTVCRPLRTSTDQQLCDFAGTLPGQGGGLSPTGCAQAIVQDSNMGWAVVLASGQG